MVHVQISTERERLHKSPFYNGHTTYGGRAAHRYSGSAGPYKVTDILLQSLLLSCVVMLS